MAEAERARSFERDPALAVAAVYRREIGASLERVWENVFDWEHLPWLHSQAFSSIEPLASGDWGWHARVGLPGEELAEIELVADRAAGRYVARTLTGSGAGTEIWTALDPVADERTDIEVEFCVSPRPPDALEQLGRGFVALYTRLWDQDEEMMQTRERALAERRVARAGRGVGADGDAEAVEAGVVRLGDFEALRARLPLVIGVGGARFRIVEVEGRLCAHATRCPHLLGPLDACAVEDGEIECPWHGYRFGVESGHSTDGRGLRLRPAPTIEIDAKTGQVRAWPAGTGPDAA